jgi:hypothetical protein
MRGFFPIYPLEVPNAQAAPAPAIAAAMAAVAAPPPTGEVGPLGAGVPALVGACRAEIMN